MIKFNPIITAFSYCKSGNYAQNNVQKKAVIPTKLLENRFFYKNKIENNLYNAFISMKDSMSEMAKYIIRRVHI